MAIARWDSEKKSVDKSAGLAIKNVIKLGGLGEL
jgi:hypothetical protein